ncbi:MAG: GntR family transcriptional regulator [Treponema sp.]|jgi:DNA-binding FadR family transcriptional regulator|nr:GntR family transcriptional regulator [Treponema sp.]
MEFNHLVSPSLKELFIKEITDSILSGKMAIGERLPNERELAKKMGVSRAVINGGMAELARWGFVKIVPRKGAFVANYKLRGKIETLEVLLKYSGGHFDPPTLDSIYEVRLCVERHITELAAKRRTEQDIISLRNQIEILSGLEDLEALSVATHEFYHLLSIASGNIIYPLNIEAYKVIYIPLMIAVYKRVPKQERIARFIKLADLIEQKDAAQALDCITEIIVSGRQVLSAHYKPGENF